MFTKEVDVYQGGRCLAARSMFSNQVEFSKATRSHNVQILGRGFLWYALIRIVLEMNAAPIGPTA